MGFFSDLKSDLSHAVNEFKPESSALSKDEEQFLKDEEAEIEAMALDMMNDDIALSDMGTDDIADLLNSIENNVKATEKEDIPAPQTPTKYEAFDNYVLPSYEVEEPAPAEPVEETPVVASVVEAEKEVVEEPAAPEIPVNTYTEPVVQQVVQPVVQPIEQPATPRRVASDEVSVIMDSMIINGNMATEGSLDIRGSIVGNVEALGKLNITGSIQGNSTAAEIFADGAKITGDVKSQGAIKIGQSTTIIGNIYATSAVIAGAIKGDIDVKGPVILDSTAIVLGNIKSKAVQINNGAVIEGMCSQCYAEVNPTSFFEELKKMR